MIIPISLLAFAEAGYKTLHFRLPIIGSSEANTLPVAGRVKFIIVYRSLVDIDDKMSTVC